jgi:hypothetical protein
MYAPQEIKLKLPAAEPLGYYGPVLQVNNVSCGYDKYASGLVATTDDPHEPSWRLIYTCALPCFFNGHRFQHTSFSRVAGASRR